ncbi:MAG: hypothetical protein ACOX6O_02045 [Christensenellales bacterium]|jgi:hypothetical protein
MNNPIKASISENLAGLYITPARHQQLMTHITGGTKVKKKLTLSLVMAIAFILLAVTAFAAIVLSRSPQADALTRARKALVEKYGLTHATLGNFNAFDKQEGDKWTVTFISGFLHPSLVGEYKVILDKDSAQASWSFDHVDKASWEKSGLEAPVWGQPQLAEALSNPAAAEAINMKRYQEDPTLSNPNMPGPEVLEGQGEDAAYWNGEIVREGIPGKDDLTRDQALEIACQAFAEDFGLTRAELEAGSVNHENFHTRENGGTLWGFGIVIEKDGMLMDCGIMLDGKTGEVLLTNIITGANE